MRSFRFVKSERALSLAIAARTFGVSPAKTYLGLDDPVRVALVDEALAMRLLTLNAEPAAADGPPTQIGPEDVYPDDEP